MKIVLLSNNVCSVPALQFLAQSHQVQAVISSAGANPITQQLQQFAAGLNIPFVTFSRNELTTGFKELLIELQPDVVLSFAYRYKIPAELFDIPRLGFYNVHFSLLPAYRGQSPVFWQLKNGDEQGGISIHQVTAEFDAGPLLMQKVVPVLPGTSHGIYWGRLSLESAAVVASAIEKLQNTGNAMLLPQSEESASSAPAPQPGDLVINWEMQSAKEIEDLVNACNPDFGGAMTLLRNQVLRVLEVTPADLNNPFEQPPGTIVYADGNHGLFVMCKDRKYLRINIVHSNEGILSGFKLAALGIQAGESLVTMQL